jgi:dTDP-4-dehydrorhamnose reductase
MNILITGSRGLVGSSLYDYLSNKNENVSRFDRETFSWSDNSLNVSVLRNFDVVIHAAANTNVEECELNPNFCYRDNTLLTEKLAYAAGIAECKFVYISSTGVYGDNKTDEPYSEYDSVNPTTHHHRAKWLGEQAVNNFVKNSLVIRTGWIFGGDTENPKNFVAQRVLEGIKSVNKEIQSNKDQIGSPTFVHDLSMKIYELLLNGEIGLFNLVNEGIASRLKFVRKIINLAKLDVNVIPVDAKLFNRKAKVSINESATTTKLTQLGYEALPSWEESLEFYINENIKVLLSLDEN